MVKRRFRETGRRDVLAPAPRGRGRGEREVEFADVARVPSPSPRGEGAVWRITSLGSRKYARGNSLIFHN